MTLQTPPSSCVVIATHGKNRRLRQTLESLSSCDRPAGFAGVYVVENGGKGDAQQVVSDSTTPFPVHYLYCEAANKSKALNLVIESTEVDLFIFLDDDVRVAPNLLQAYVESASEHQTTHYYGGPLEVDWEQPPPDWLLRFLPGSARGWRPSTPEELNNPSFLGANWAAFRKTLQAAGGFNVHLGPALSQGVGEDTQMQVSLQSTGVKPKYVEQAVVWHYVPQECCSPDWSLRRVYRNALSFGIRMEDDSPQLLGVPRWMLREYLRRTFTACWRVLSRQASESVHEAKAELRTIKGWMDGFREGQKIKNGSVETISN